VIIISTFIIIVFAVALMPTYNNAIQMAQASWPEGSLILSLVPSPIGFALAVLLAIVVLVAAYIAIQSS